KKIFSSASNNTLQIVGNVITPTHRIMSVLRQYPVPSKPIYLFNTAKIEKEIKKLPPIKEVYIKRLWFPARLNIIIVERKPILSIAPKQDIAPVAIFAEGGILIGHDYLPLKTNDKTILVLTYGTKGDDYRNWDEKKIKKIETIVNAMEQFSGQDVEYIDLRNPKDVYIKLPEVSVRLGELDFMALSRVRNISAILPQIKTLEKKIKYIDLRWADAQYIKLDE
ncbi:FtsQ-type POTRA domain-containing protein, partial [bacterium]|nr:FtsQ-type POTRA domain-containing protein [bacterium]